MKQFYGDDFKLIVNQNYGHMEIELYGLVEKHVGYGAIVGFDGDHIVEQELTKENEMAPWKDFKPLLRISMFQFKGLVNAFIDYANSNNIHTEAEDHIKGKLEAKEAHLTDMQEMSKKLLDALIKIKQP
jgi:hypothetical protein